jgi:ATP synthase F1 complex assembly factor 2
LRATPRPRPRAGLDAWRLTAVEQATAACKSLVLAAALLAGRVSPAAAVAAARLEEAFQIEDWGAVEAGHDLDAADLGTRVAAPSLLVRLLARGGG